MNEIIKNLLYFLISSGIIAWLVKAIFNQYFSKDLEKFKSSLEREAFSYQVRYEKMHAERAEVIKNLYIRIVTTERSFYDFMHIFQRGGDDDQKKKGPIAAKAANDMTEYYDKNKIFFTEKEAEKIEKLMDKFKEIWNTFESSQFKKAQNLVYVDDWDKSWNQIKTEIPKIRNVIEKRFRKVIGISNEN
jgi:hypothetical protein